MDDQSYPAPPTDHIDPDDPHTMTAPLEIQSVLRNVKLGRALVHLHVPGMASSMITTILDVDSKQDLLIFDSSADAHMNQQIQRARKLICQASVERIQVKFVCPAAKPCEFEGKPAFATTFPAALSYLQRRDYFRIDTPVANPVMCRITVIENKKPRVVTLPLADISAGGVGLYDEMQLPDHSMGTVYKDCQITLPDVGLLKVDLRIKHVVEQTLPNGKARFRLGCEFERPSGPMLNLVQRYVSRLERELIAKRRGFN
jgi:c-di-GMP-binding flagellar brake protein YcgR